MNPQHLDLSLRMNLLAERVGRIERHLGLEPFKAAGPARGAGASAVAEVAASPEVVAAKAATPDGVGGAEGVMAMSDAARIVDGASAEGRARALRSLLDAPGTVPGSAPAASTTGESEAFSVERLIGQRWFAAAGALIVVVGVALFFKLAYDLGWLGRMPPMVRCAAGGLFGVALLGLGEWLRSKAGRLAAAGASSAGVGVLYASAYAAYGMFGLVSPAGALMMLVGCVGIGLFIGARAGLAVVAAVSLVGGYMAPLLLGRSDASPLFMPAYLVALMIVAQVLTAWKSIAQRSFVSLRWISWVFTAALGTLWLLAQGDGVVGWALVFIAAVWSLVQGELLWTGRRADLLLEPLESEDGRVGAPAPAALGGALALREGAWIVSSLGATAWAVLFATLLVEEAKMVPTWLVPAAFFAVTFPLSIVFAGHLRTMVDMPRSAGERLGAGFLVQAGALACVTLALALSGWALALSMLAFGLASVAAGRWTRAAALTFYGAANMGLGTMVFLFTSGMGTAPAVDYMGVPMNAVQWRAMLIGAAWLSAAWMMLTCASVMSGLRVIAMVVGVIFVALAPALNSPEAGPIVAYWAVLGAVLALVLRAWPGLYGWVFGLIVHGLALVACAVEYVPGWQESKYVVIGHPGLWLTGLVCLGMAWAVFGGVPSAVRRHVIGLVGGVSGIALFVVTSLEVARASAMLASDQTAARAGVSIYWGLLAVAMLWSGFVLSRAWLRYVGLGLMAVAALKVVIVDLAGIDPVWRVVSFIVMGLLMLAVAAGYGWATRRIGSGPSGRATGDGVDKTAGGV